MENLLQAFSLDEPFALELYGTSDRQHFLMRAGSEEALETLCQQLLAQYPQAQLQRVSPVADPLIIAGNEHALVGDFTLRTPVWMPIKTFWNEEMTQEGADPLVGVLAAMEPVSTGERILCQLSLVRAPTSWGERYQRKALEGPIDKERRERSEEARATAQDSLWRESRLLLCGMVALYLCAQGYIWYSSHAWGQLALLILLALGGCAALTWWKLRHREIPYDTKLVGEKLLRAAFYAQLRVFVIGSTRRSEKRLRQHLSRLEVAYRQYDLAGANGFQLHRIQHILTNDRNVNQFCRPEWGLPYHRSFTRLLHGGWSSTILNARELSGMWHLLQSQAEAPLVKRLATRRILAAPEVFQSIGRKATDFPPVLAGYSIHRGYTVPVYLPEEALFSHTFVIAKSGYGKSTLMQLLLCGAMQPRQAPLRPQPGVVALDPHGDLIEDLLRQIPSERAREVVLIDLADTEHPAGINLLDATMGFSCDQAVANAMASFSRIWKDSWGPRLAYVLKNTLKTLYTANEQLVATEAKSQQYTLLDINPMLQQPKYARKILAGLDKEKTQHQKILSFWNDYYFKLPPNMQQEVISPVSNKIGLFSDNSQLERIVGQPVTTINVAAAVQAGRIVLVNLASGRLEFDAAAILGATILNLVHRALQLQAAVPLPERRKVFIAVDEFQNIPGADYEAFLSEDRKYGGSLMLATQSLVRLEQMKEGLQTIALSNCAQLFVFATSAEDAETLEKELQGQVALPHILNQPRLNCYARLTLSEQPLQIFSMQLAKPASWERTLQGERLAGAIRQVNRTRYPTSEQVERYLAARMQRILGLTAPAQSGATKQAAKQRPAPANAAKGSAQPVTEQKAAAKKQAAPENAGRTRLDASQAQPPEPEYQQASSEGKSSSEHVAGDQQSTAAKKNRRKQKKKAPAPVSDSGQPASSRPGAAEVA